MHAMARCCICATVGRSSQHSTRLRNRCIGNVSNGVSACDADFHKPLPELLNSTFVLVPRGDMPYAYRLIEALAFGAIPVVLSDEYILPFSELLDWPSFAVRWPCAWERESNISTPLAANFRSSTSPSMPMAEAMPISIPFPRPFPCPLCPASVLGPKHCL